jgi:hypothetical protein
LVQPSPDRAIQHIFFDPLDLRRVPQCLEQHGCRMLAVPPDRAAAPTGDHDRIGIIDFDKDVIRARTRTPDRGDQALPTFVRAQVANGTFAMVGTSLFETAGEATSDIALIEGD